MAISDSQGVYAVPAAVEGYGIVYNEELMERYIELDTKGTAIQSAEQIRDLDTFEDVVKDMEAHKKDLGIDGVFASPSLEKENRRPWIKYLAGAVLAEEFADNPDYDNEILSTMASSHIEFRDSDCYKRLIDLYTKHGVKKNGLSRVTIEDSLEELAMGKCVMLQTGNWSWHYLSSVKGTVLNPEKLKMLPIYLGTKGDANRGICIGTEDYLAINKQASEKDKEASLEFLRWLYGSAEGKELVLNKLGFIAPFNTFSHKDVPNNPLAKEVVRYMEDEERKNVAWVFTAFPDDDFYEDVGEDLYKYISGKIDFPKFVQEFQKEWKEESVATASTKGYNKQE